ncbi:MAG: zinc ribbon domain-containing protein [Hyphomicrobiaceae bacterium]|nr:zinc ribbon domain-containing protein [Hyphomicrobiaceae bacterium]
MPIYGFHCNACNKEFETLVRSSETAECPSCGSTDLARQLSLIAQPNRGGDTGGGYASGSSDAPPCASGSCCFGGGCG